MLSRSAFALTPRWAGDVQHAASALGAGLQAAGATKLDFTARGCDINFPVHRGTKFRLGRMTLNIGWTLDIRGEKL